MWSSGRVLNLLKLQAEIQLPLCKLIDSGILPQKGRTDYHTDTKACLRKAKPSSAHLRSPLKLLENERLEIQGSKSLIIVKY